MKDGNAHSFHPVMLGEVCDFENGDRGKNYPGRKAFVPSGIPFVNAGHISDGLIDWEGMDYIPEDRFDLLGSGKIRQGDILYCLRGSLGKFGIVDCPQPGAIASSLVIVRPTERINVNFLAYFFRSPLAEEMVKRFAGGAAQPNLSAKSLSQYEIPLPPLEEQRRIVAVLDQAFEGLARARTNIETNLQNQRELFENFLSEIMTSNADDWKTYSFGEKNVVQIVDGDRGTNYPKKTDFKPDGHCLFLSTKNVRPDGFNFNETMFISKKHDQALRKGKLQARDVILTTRGTIGNVAFFDETVPYENIRINSGMLILRPNESIVRAEFLSELLRSSVIKEQIAAHVSGAAQPQLPIRSLVKFELPAPKSTDQQLQIVDQLKHLNDNVAELEQNYSAKLQDLDDLRQSLLQKAFAGELTS